MKRLLAPLVLVLLATGCAAPAATTTPATTTPALASSEAAPEVTPTPVIMGPGEYTFESISGAKGVMQVPAKPVPEIEALRALAPGAPKVTYLTVKVDNRQGTVGVNMYQVSIFTAEGEELKYTGVDQYLSSIRPGDAPAEIYNQFIDAGNKHGEMANPKAVKEFILTGPPVPETITGVTVYPTGISDPVDALPAP